MTEIYESKRRDMVREQLAGRGIKDQRVLDAFARVKRHLFIPKEQRHKAYEDHPLAIGCDQTISQPYVVALILAELGLQGCERVLEIGTGSGYQTALFGELAARVYSVEFFPDLAARARKVLDEMGYGHISLRVGDGRRGWREEAPFDAVICSAAPAQIPTPLMDQLAPTGRLILPLGIERQHLVVVRRTPSGFAERKLAPVRFVPMQ